MSNRQRGIHYFLFFLQIIAASTIAAQHNVKINGKLENETLKYASIEFTGRVYPPDDAAKAELIIPIKNNRFSTTIEIDEPEIAILYLETENGFFSQPLFLAKDYQLNLKLTIQNNQLLLETTGIGANDNQRLDIQTDHELKPIVDRLDLLPDSAYLDLRKFFIKDSIAIENYIQKYQPTEAFRTAWRLQCRYSFFYEYILINENRRKRIPSAYAENKKHWKQIKYDLLRDNPIVNEKAFKAKVPAYLNLIERFIHIAKDSIQNERTDPIAFVNEWFGEEMKREGKSFRPDSKNLLTKKIIDRFFTGGIRDYLYAVLFKNALAEIEMTNLENIYKAYASKYPDSKYLPIFDRSMQDFFERTTRRFTPAMKFIEGRDTIHTFKQLIQIVKGKTILLDMWGTWCGPCRSDISKHSAIIKAHFKNKPVDYLYVANLEEENEKGWKELISFYQMEGYHILASAALTKDIMTIVKGTGYPTYVIIRPDGSIELSKTQYPMKREVLIQQIEELLK
jgi:thiol-disulfide isomerase/thioredoxin